MLKLRQCGNQPQRLCRGKNKNVLIKEINAGLVQPEWVRHHCCRIRAKDTINPMTTQWSQQKKRKPHRGHASTYTWQVHRSVITRTLYQMGIRTHRINIVSLTRIKLRQIIQVDCCFYGTVQCVFYNII